MRKPILVITLAIVLALSSKAALAEDQPQIQAVSNTEDVESYSAQAAELYLQQLHATEVAVQAYLHHLWIESLPKIPPVLVAIARCESVNGAYTYRDHPSPKSTASGKYGFVDGTWRSWRGTEGAAYARAYQAPEWVQDAAALRLYQASGTKPWNASRDCWS